MDDADLRHALVESIPVLRAYAWGLLRRPQDVDDLVQETLTKAISRATSFQPGTNLRAWLVTIMRNTFYTAARKQSRERTGVADCVSTTLSVPPTQEWKVAGNEVIKAIRGLPLQYRETLVLVVMLGESYEATARLVGVPIGTVKSRVNRARMLVMEQLGEAAPASRPSGVRTPATGSEAEGQAEAGEPVLPRA